MTTTTVATILIGIIIIHYYSVNVFGSYGHRSSTHFPIRRSKGFALCRVIKELAKVYGLGLLCSNLSHIPRGIARKSQHQAVLFLCRPSLAFFCKSEPPQKVLLRIRHHVGNDLRLHASWQKLALLRFRELVVPVQARAFHALMILKPP